MSLLDKQLSTVSSRYRRLEWWRSLSIVCILLAIVGVGLLWMQVSARWMYSQSGWLLLTSACIGLAVHWVLTWNCFRDRSWVARQIEQHYPELDQRLVTTLDQRDRNQGKPLGYLQHTVFQETMAHSYHNPWWKVVSPKLMQGFRSRGLVALCLMMATAIALMKWQPPATAFVARMATATADNEDIAAATADFDIRVEPGNTEVEKGTNLIVVARFGKQTPKVAELVASSGSNALRVPMSRSLEDPLFGGTIADVQEDFEYYVAYGRNRSETFRATVFTYPELVRGDALLEYPGYTNLAQKRIEDTRRVSVVEGTRVTWEMHLNKSDIDAQLVPVDGGEAVPLQVDTRDSRKHLASFDLAKTTSWKLVLKDKDGRENRNPPTIIAKVVPNRPPNLKLELARDVRVSPLEEFLVKATVSDDYGLSRYGLNYTLASASSEDVVLGEATARHEKQSADHMMDFEALEAEPDQLLSYYFWAEDQDAAGNARRTSSDMYFAEVRHFEEIFRQGQQRPQNQQQQQQQQSQSAQDAEQLAELQKQIINASWRVIRRETGFAVSSKFAEDVSLIIESQQAASEQVEELARNVEDSKSQQYVLDVQQQMQVSLQELTNAYSDPDATPLTPAMTAQRAAYQALLQLRAREHEVVQNQQQQGRPNSGSPSRRRFQQQLQQLELENDENRYETQRQAQDQQDQEQSEMRQALNRLRELAQRQEDLNEQLKELQNALEQAESEEEREEIQRQLKRLRDQQQEMLRDVDELMDRLEESENQQTLQETREQLEQTREQLRDSAESLEGGEVTPALASGTRAQRELEEMREELRRESANQFEEQMRDMRERVRELDDRQHEIGQRLEDENDATTQGARLRREEPKDEKLGEALREQNEKLNKLLQEIEETVQEAEETEPLLAESLYDAFRETKQDQVQRKLDRAAQLSDAGLNEPAHLLEKQARESISNFRENIDRAAERVLGDETQALRTAVRLLEDLERQLDEEIDQFDQQRPSAPRQNPSSDVEQAERDSEGRREDAQDRQNRQRSQSEQPQQQKGQPRQQGQPGEPSGRSEQSPEQEEQDPSQQGQGQGMPSEQEQDQESRAQSQSQQDDSPSEQQNGAGQNQRDDQGQRQQPGGRQPSTLRQGGDRQRDGGQLGGWEQLQIAPITGEDFREWSDRLRDVEEIVGDPDLRAEAARIREAARGFRREFKRHSEEPKWNLIKETVARPLQELRQEVSAELRRRSGAKNALVPIDRDPVPAQFTEQVRRYYENLGRGE